MASLVFTVPRDQPYIKPTVSPQLFPISFPPSNPSSKSHQQYAMASSQVNEAVSDATTFDSDISVDSDFETQSPPTKIAGASIKSLHKLSEASIMKSLKEALHGYQARASYSLGGSIPIVSFPESSQDDSSTKSPQMSLPPVALRFDIKPEAGEPEQASEHSPSIAKVIFPPLGSLDDSGLLALVKACTPATFGLGGKDVLDETYRKAGKLDREDFCVDFHPADYGIVSAIAQTLLPSVAKAMANREEKNDAQTDKKGDDQGGRKTRRMETPAEAEKTKEKGKKDALSEHWGVLAQLYKLNVRTRNNKRHKAC